MRALLDLLRENEAAVQDELKTLQYLLRLATSKLKILDPVSGEEELIKSMAAEVAKLREMAGKTQPLQAPRGG